MADVVHRRAHVISGGFPPGSNAGHDHDYARLRLLTLLAERQVPASVANDFSDIEKLYGADTSLQSDGKTRVLGYTREVGLGAVTYLALGHCHNPYSRMGAGSQQPATFRGPWESDAFRTLLGNAIAWATA